MPDLDAPPGIPTLANDQSPRAAPGSVSSHQAVRRRFHRLRRGRSGVVFWLAVGWLVLVAAAAIFAPLLPLPSANAVDPFHRLSPIGTPGHLLGTDTLGRDVLSRLAFGGRVSLTVGVSSVLMGLLVGGALGMVAGFFRGPVEKIVMWAMDVILSFPALILLICVVAFVGHSLAAITLVIAVLTIPVYARLARVHTLSVSQREFVTAARAIGMRRRRILFREVTPNILPPVLSYGLISIGVVIVVEGTLSFLGLSVSAPAPSWGGLIAAGQNDLIDDPALVLVPSVVLSLTVLALNLAGDRLRSRHETGDLR
jgi:peptide/nickel transport system permease protein